MKGRLPEAGGGLQQNIEKQMATLIQMAETAHSAAESSEASLIRAAKSGDEPSFGALIRAHQDRVFRLCSRFYRRSEDVEDAAQETFLLVWRKLSTYRGDAPFEHWITRVCLNCCYQRLRKKRLATDPIDFDLPGEARDPDTKLDAERLVASLPAADRFLLLLLHGEGWSVAEIAERTGWSRPNVKVRAFRARKKLRRIVESGGAG